MANDATNSPTGNSNISNSSSVSPPPPTPPPPLPSATTGSSLSAARAASSSVRDARRAPRRSGLREMEQNRPPVSRLQPVAPTRSGPGAAVRITSVLTSSSTVQPQQQRGAPTSPAPSLPLRNSAVSPSSSRFGHSNTGSVSVGVPHSRQPQPPCPLVSTIPTGAAVESEVITLSQPRPDGDRIRNEYIDTPLKGGFGNNRAALLTPLHAETHIHISGSPHDHLALVSPVGGGSGVGSGGGGCDSGNRGHQLMTVASSSSCSSSKSLPFVAHCTPMPATSPSLKRLQSSRRSLPITKQQQQASPVGPFTKDPSSSSSHTLCSIPSSHFRQQQLLRSVRGTMVGSPTSAASSVSVHEDAFCHSNGMANTWSVASNGSRAGGDSIICPECSRCRCESCRTPRPLPSRWLCEDKCLCSADSCVDYLSCFCCVKGLFYHCGSNSDDDDDDEEEDDIDDDDVVHTRHERAHKQSHCRRRRRRVTPRRNGAGGSCADDPCSCAPSHHRLARWGCLASLSLVLPCLLCYWPLRGAVQLVELCYQRCTRHGCRCDQKSAHHPTCSSVASSSSGGGGDSGSGGSGGGNGHLQRLSNGQRQEVVVSLTTSSKAVISSQPLPTSGKRLLDI